MVPWPQVERLAFGEPLSSKDVRVLSLAFPAMWAYLGIREDVPTKSVIVVGSLSKKSADNQQILLAKALARFLNALDQLNEEDRKIWEAKHVEKLDLLEIWSVYIRRDSTPLTSSTIRNGTRNVSRRLKKIYRRIANLLTNDAIYAKMVYDLKVYRVYTTKKVEFSTGRKLPSF